MEAELHTSPMPLEAINVHNTVEVSSSPAAMGSLIMVTEQHQRGYEFI